MLEEKKGTKWKYKRNCRLKNRFQCCWLSLLLSASRSRETLFDRSSGLVEKQKKNDGKKFISQARKKSIGIRSARFVEPQWQILKFLTQFYTFKKFQSSSAFIVHKISFCRYLCFDVHASLNVPRFISFQPFAKLSESPSEFEERKKEKNICRSNLIVCKWLRLYGKFSAFCFWSWRFSFVFRMLWTIRKHKKSDT